MVTTILKPLSLLNIKYMLMGTQGQTIINYFNPEQEYNREKNLQSHHVLGFNLMHSFSKQD